MKRAFALIFCLVVASSTSAGLPRLFGTQRTPSVETTVYQPPKTESTNSEPDPAVEAMKRTAPPPARRMRYSAADPIDPQLSMPDVIVGDIDDFIEVQAETNCDEIVFYAVTKGLKVFPRKFLNQDVAKSATIVIAKAEGDYTMLAVGALGSKIAGPVEFIVRIGHAPQPPPAPGPGPTPSPGPTPPAPTVKAAKLFVFTIDNAETRTAARLQFLNDPYWFQLKVKGHAFEKYNTTRTDVMSACTAELAMNGGSGTPIIIIRDAVTNKWLNKNPADLKLPVDAASFKALISKYTDNIP